MSKRGERWVRAQIPLLAAAAAWPVAQHLLETANVWIPVLTWPARVLGFLVLVAGILTFRAAARVLGDDLVAVPAPRDDGVLRTDGMYAYVRHPIYVGIILSLFGWSLLWTSPVGLALSAACLVFFVCKTSAEERYLQAAYPRYASYRRSVPRFIPRFPGKSLM